MRSAHDYAAYLFDLDGTVYLGTELIPGADRAVRSLRGAGREVMFLSNKPIATRASYARKLTELGIPTGEEAVLNSSLATARWLAAEMPGARAYVIGEAPLIEDLVAAGIRPVNEPLETDVVVVSWDRDFSYRKLDEALQALLRGARLVATNPDATCPTGNGTFVPDCGAVAAAVEAACGRRVETYAGKPSSLMARLALERLGVAPDECLMVGDRVETDIIFGRNAGMATALVLTGAGRLRAAAEAPVQPDFVLESIADLTLPS